MNDYFQSAISNSQLQSHVVQASADPDLSRLDKALAEARGRIRSMAEDVSRLANTLYGALPPQVVGEEKVASVGVVENLNAGCVSLHSELTSLQCALDRLMRLA